MDQSTLPWTKKYHPKTAKEIVGQETVIEKLRAYILAYKKQKKKAVLLYGPTGCGKTSMVHAIAHELHLEILEVNASDTRNADAIQSVIGIASRQMSLFSAGKVILIDEIDGLSGQQDRGGVSALLDVLEKSAFPLILTANDPFDQKFSTLRKKVEMFECSILSHTSIYDRLKHICGMEHITHDETTLKSLARMAGGDMRAAITDLQTLTLSGKLAPESLSLLAARNREESIKDALHRVFKTEDPALAIAAFDNVGEDLDEIMLWMDENIPQEYETPADLARAYDFVSKADIMKKRIQRWQHWRFLVYVSAYLSAGVAVSKEEKYRKVVEYKPTSRILRIWMANAKYAKRKDIAKKVAEQIHASSKDVIQSTIPYLKMMFRRNKELAGQLIDEFDFNDEEVEWLKK